MLKSCRLFRLFQLMRSPSLAILTSPYNPVSGSKKWGNFANYTGLEGLCTVLRMKCAVYYPCENESLPRMQARIAAQRIPLSPQGQSESYLLSRMSDRL